MEKNLLNDMFANLLHIGNKANYWNPKMKNYIYGTVNGIHVFNLVETVKKIDEVKAELKALHAEGKKILFVATKLQSRDAFISLAEATGHYYVSEKWVPGLLTNFKTIKRRIATYVKLMKDAETGSLDMLTKKEKAGRLLELEKLDKAYKGLKDMKKIPEVIFVVDGIYEEQAIKEANSLKLKAYAILNTNGDDTVVDNLIPANTNSVKSIEFIANILKTELVGTKVVPVAGNIKKIDTKKISGEFKKPRNIVKKAPVDKKFTGQKSETKTQKVENSQEK